MSRGGPLPQPGKAILLRVVVLGMPPQCSGVHRGLLSFVQIAELCADRRSDIGFTRLSASLCWCIAVAACMTAAPV